MFRYMIIIGDAEKESVLANEENTGHGFSLPGLLIIVRCQDIRNDPRLSTSYRRKII